MPQVPFEIYRGDDRQFRFQTYLLDVPEDTPILTALLRIRDEIDPTLTLRYSCRQAICGSCAMRVNGKSRLACLTMVGPEFRRRGKLRVEPMANQPVLRDLVVDQDPFWQRYRAIRPYLIPDPTRPMPVGQVNPMTPAQVDQFRETPRCIACASCYSACPAVAADPAFLGPMALAKLYRFVVDPRDGAYRERLAQVQNQSLWLCLRCNLCVEACPKDVRPAERIVDLKWMANQEIGAREEGSRHALAFMTNIREGGLLNETKLVRQTLGIWGLLSQIPKGLAMMRRGRSLSRHPPITDREQLDVLYRELDGPEDLQHRLRPPGRGVKGDAPSPSTPGNPPPPGGSS
jgi:succinate dehydrogenase / fumarate reductase iron-sulfur subunit